MPRKPVFELVESDPVPVEALFDFARDLLGAYHRIDKMDEQWAREDELLANADPDGDD